MHIQTPYIRLSSQDNPVEVARVCRLLFRHCYPPDLQEPKYYEILIGPIVNSSDDMELDTFLSLLCLRIFVSPALISFLQFLSFV